MAPPHTFFEAVLDAEEASELTELEVSEAGFDSELAIEEVAELNDLEALDAPSDS
jgi:formyltetrahydrofolate synthetase